MPITLPYLTMPNWVLPLKLLTKTVMDKLKIYEYHADKALDYLQNYSGRELDAYYHLKALQRLRYDGYDAYVEYCIDNNIVYKE